MSKHNIMIVFLFMSIWTNADEARFLDHSGTIHPLLDEVAIIHQDEDSRYRALIFRGGYEHISAYIVFQKFSIEQNGRDRYYHLVSAITIDEINYIYNFGIDTIKKDDRGFLVILEGTHSYTYDDVTIEIHLSEDLEYEIVSGLNEI